MCQLLMSTKKICKINNSLYQKKKKKNHRNVEQPMCSISNPPHPFFVSGPMFMGPRRAMKCEPSITNASSLKKPLLQIIFQLHPRTRSGAYLHIFQISGYEAHLLQDKSNRSDPQINTEGDTYQIPTLHLAGAAAVQTR